MQPNGWRMALGVLCVIPHAALLSTFMIDIPPGDVSAIPLSFRSTPTDRPSLTKNGRSRCIRMLRLRRRLPPPRDGRSQVHAQRHSPSVFPLSVSLIATTWLAPEPAVSVALGRPEAVAPRSLTPRLPSVPCPVRRRLLSRRAGVARGALQVRVVVSGADVARVGWWRASPAWRR